MVFQVALARFRMKIFPGLAFSLDFGKSDRELGRPQRFQRHFKQMRMTGKHDVGLSNVLIGFCVLSATSEQPERPTFRRGSLPNVGPLRQPSHSFADDSTTQDGTSL